MKRALIAIAALVVLGIVVFCAVAYRPAIAEITPPDPAGFDAALVERGEQLAAAGNCETCHTIEGGANFAGGYEVKSDFGTIYATNITPDPETGIGTWSEEAFQRAMRKGIRRDGAHLFPAFPYTHFTHLTDEDISALYAYLMTVEPASYEPPENTLGLANWRALQGGWKLLFFRGAGAFEPEDDMSPEWNRGAYLAEGIGHCSACHTPRNFLGAEKGGGARYSGAEVNNWYAPSINEDPDAAAPWTQDELYGFLRSGASALHGVAAGSMSEVVHAGLGVLPDSDVEALSVYFADVAGTSDGAQAVAAPSLLERTGGLDAAQTRGAQVFGSFCVSCHFTPPEAPDPNRPALSVNSAIVGPDPKIFVRVVLHGVSAEEGNPNAFMPGFANTLSNQDVADIAAYLRASYADEPGEWDDMAEMAAEER